MKTLNQLIYILFIATVFCNCSEDFLETNPQEAISSGTFWATAQDAELALAGCYDVMQEDWMYALRNQNHASLRERECFTDNSMNGFLYQRYNNIKNGTLNATNDIPLLRPWRVLYRGIGRCNQVIANAPLLEELSAEEIDLILAQAKAIRALMYWNLANAWDDVPLVLTPLGPEELEVPKSPALDVFQQIVTDLEEAAGVLPESWTGADFGKITSGAVNALLARVELFLHGYYNMAGSAQRAAEATQTIISSGQYELFPDYESLFMPANEDCREIIWSVRFSVDLGGDNGEGFSSSSNNQPQANNQPLQNFVDAFYCIDGLPIDQSPLYDPDAYWENRDPRWDANIVYAGEKWLENRPPFNLSAGIRRTGYAIDKYIIDNNEGIAQNNGGQDWYIFRYADVLLMRAESLIETGNTGQEVYDLINAVRQRAGMPKIEDVEGAGLSAAALTDILRHERRVELAFENTRFVDLKRWGTMPEAYERSALDKKPGGVNPILSGVTYQGDRSVILPIHQSELDANPALVQHPAWE